jgi:hypothetical protein
VDGHGRVVESSPVIELGSGPIDLGRWTAARLEQVRTFRQRAVSRLLARWRAIHAACAADRPRGTQPALFDRRALDSAAAAAASRAALDYELRLRIARLERSAAVDSEPPALRLIAFAAGETR